MCRWKNSPRMAALAVAALAVAGVMLAHHAPPAAAATVAFDGVISAQGSFLDPTGNFAPGDAVTGFWSFDPATPDGDAAVTRGEYPQTGAPVFQMTINGHTFSANSTTIQILDDHTLGIGVIDAYDVLSAPASSTVPGLQVTSMQITLRDTAPPLDALVSDLLPTTAPNPLAFDQIGQAAGQITGATVDGPFFMNLEIRATRLVPEPAGITSMLAGVAALAIRRRKI